MPATPSRLREGHELQRTQGTQRKSHAETHFRRCGEAPQSKASRGPHPRRAMKTKGIYLQRKSREEFFGQDLQDCQDEAFWGFFCRKSNDCRRIGRGCHGTAPVDRKRQKRPPDTFAFRYQCREAWRPCGHPVSVPVPGAGKQAGTKQPCRLVVLCWRATGRNPLLSFLLPGLFLLRFADRQFDALFLQLPPRSTRLSPESAWVCSP